MSGTPARALRLLEDRDEPLYVALYTSPRVMRNIAPAFSPAEAGRAFHRMCRHNLCDSPGDRLWVVEEAATPVGLVGVNRCGEGGEVGVIRIPRMGTPDAAAWGLHAALSAAFDTAGLQWMRFQARPGAGSRAAWRLIRRYAPRPEAPHTPGFETWRLDRADWFAGHAAV